MDWKKTINDIRKWTQTRTGITTICCAVCVIVIIVVAAVISSTNKTGTEEEAVEALTEGIAEEAEEKSLLEQDIELLESLGIPVPDKEVDIVALQEETNEDIYAWIYIPDTVIDYPIVQDPDDNTYYLSHNLDGSDGYPGCIYSENYNSTDFTDSHTVLYGHNMSDGSMFGDLDDYSDETFFEEHPYIYIYTETRLFAYEIYAAYRSGDEHLLLNYDLTDTSVFQEYLTTAQTTAENARGIYTASWEPTGEEHILTLSTCVAANETKRYLVQAILVEE